MQGRKAHQTEGPPKKNTKPKNKQTNQTNNKNKQKLIINRVRTFGKNIRL